MSKFLSISMIEWELFNSCSHSSKQGAGLVNSVQRCIVWQGLVLIHHPNVEIFQQDRKLFTASAWWHSGASVCLLSNGACHWLRGKGRAAPRALSQEVSGGWIHVHFSPSPEPEPEPHQCTRIPERPAFSLVWRLSHSIPYKHGTYSFMSYTIWCRTRLDSNSNCLPAPNEPRNRLLIKALVTG